MHRKNPTQNSWVRRGITWLLTVLILLTAFPVNLIYADDAPYGMVGFRGGGGDGSMATYIADSTTVTSYTIPACEFSYPGYTFDHWVDLDENSYDPGDTVQVQMGSTSKLGLTAAWVKDNSAWERTPDSATAQDGTIDLYLKAGESVEISDIPANTAYKVWEETPFGWVLVESSGASGKIGPLDYSEASLTNRYQPGVTAAQIIGTKKLDNIPCDKDAFEFSLYEGNTLIETVSTLAGGYIQFSSIEYDDTMLGRHTYTIKEVNPNDETIDWDTHSETVYVDVTDNGDGTLSTAVTYDNDGVAFFNTTRPGTLKITKNAVNLSTENANDEFTFKVTLNNEKGIPLSNDTDIYWYKEDSSGNPIQNTLNRLLTRSKSALTLTDNDLDKALTQDKLLSSDGLTVDGTIVDESDGADTSGVSNTETIRNVRLASTNLLGASGGTVLKYAVSIYGIGIDLDENGDTMGLTFGPALGANYVQSYKSHTATGTTTSGNAHRCVHNDDWSTIISWNSTDPYVYEQCITEGCTHSVELSKNTTTTMFNESFDPSQETGDGPSALWNELLVTSSNQENLRWGPKTEGGSSGNGSNKNGWGASRLRAMLNGRDELDTLSSAYSTNASSDVNKSYTIYTETNSLFAMFPAELQAAIGARATKYDSVYNAKTTSNLKTSYDKLWVLSPDEIWTTSQNNSTNFAHPLEGSQYPYFAAKSLTTSTTAQTDTVAYYVNSYTGSNSGAATRYWLRSSYGTSNNNVTNVDGGKVVNCGATYTRSVSPCFALTRTAASVGCTLRFDANDSTASVTWKDSSGQTISGATFHGEVGDMPASIPALGTGNGQISVTNSISAKTFTGWNTAADGSGTAYAAGAALPSWTDGDSLVLYAQWYFEANTALKYAVALYGIGVDVDEDDKPMGLTFGPALGANYVQSYHSHTATGTTSSGNTHRCIHDDDWTTIISWNNTDPYVYEQCIAEGCTHSVELSKNTTTTILNESFDPAMELGDGPSTLWNELMVTSSNSENLRWNPKTEGGNATTGTNKEGWGASRIRAMLNGQDELDTLGSSYASDASSDVNKDYSIYTASNNLLAMFPAELRAAIGARATKYDSVYNSTVAANLKTSYDKLWLLSTNEIWAAAQNTGIYAHTQEGQPYPYFTARTMTASTTQQTSVTAYYVNSYSGNNVGEASRYWLRSVYGANNNNVTYVNAGALSMCGACYVRGVAPCFSLSYEGCGLRFDGNNTGATVTWKDSSGHIIPGAAILGAAANMPTTVPAEGTGNGQIAATSTAGTFNGWNTKADGTGINYAPGDPLPAWSTGSQITLYAQWGNAPFKYAVSLYGIEMDQVAVDEVQNTEDTASGADEVTTETGGLTFGPALGTNYVQSYKSHTPTGKTTLGHDHRCIHDDDWTTIILWNNYDPYVYEQCIAEGCTHSVELSENSTTTLYNDSFDPSMETGDGPSTLYYELMPGSSSNYENLRWNPKTEGGSGAYGTNKNGWGATRIRAMLNGRDALDTLTGYANSASDDVNQDYAVYTSSNNLLAMFPAELQEAIGARATKYDSVYNSKTEANLKTSYDKLWLLSPNEIWTTAQITNIDYTHPLEGTQYPYFAAKSSTSNQTGTVAYRVTNYSGNNSGALYYWWLRSSYGLDSLRALDVNSSGKVYGNSADNRNGVSPCFTLTREIPKPKYAVSLYGIRVDQVAVDDVVNTESTATGATEVETAVSGLTFGPALGANYVQSYKSHTPTGTTTSGNKHRCIHDDEWTTIIQWNNIDPYVYEQCIAEGCTHSIELSKNNTTTILNEDFVPVLETGDGPSALYYELTPGSSDNVENLRWNPKTEGGSGTYGTNKNGWGATRIRAMLNGRDALDTLTGYATIASGDVNQDYAIYTSSNNLFAMFPAELQAAIGARATKYDSVVKSKTAANLRTTYDKLWLLSPNEIWTTALNADSDYTHPLEGTQYPYFAAKSLTTSTINQTGTVAYRVNNYSGNNRGASYFWWLRSFDGDSGNNAITVNNNGNVNNTNAYGNNGVSPCFSLGVLDPSKAVLYLDVNGGYIESSQLNIVTQESIPSATKPGAVFLGWNTEPDGSGTYYQAGDTAGIDGTNSDITVELGAAKILYAIWEEGGVSTYTVRHYQQNMSLTGYTLTETEILNGTAGESVTPATKSYTGFVSPAAQTVTIAGNNSTAVNYNYTRIQYDIAFDGNDATSGMIEMLHMIYGVSETLPANTFSREGHIFAGWNTAADGSGTSFVDRQISVMFSNAANGDVVTLYAQWLDNSADLLNPTNGVIYVTCKATETIVLPDLPAGTTYTIEEVSLPDGWSYTSSINETGTITGNGTASASFNNTYNANGEVSLEAHKRLTGASVTSGQFTFQLLDPSGNVIQTQTNDIIDTTETIDVLDEDFNVTGSVANPWYGTAPVVFDSIQFTAADIGETYTYQIREVNSADPTINYDSHVENVAITVNDAGKGLVTATVTYDADGPLFENSVKNGSLSVEKSVVNASASALNTNFDFTLDVIDAEGHPYTGPVTITKYIPEESPTATTANADDTFQLKANEQVIISGLPHGATYTITEGEKTGWTLLNEIGAEGTISVSSMAEASFVNGYYEEGEAVITARKNLVGGDISGMTFYFELLDEEMNVLQTAQSDENGNITFDPIEYDSSQDGQTFVYFIREIASGMEDAIYDTSIYRAEVAVEETGTGQMSAVVTYPEGTPVFTNIKLNSIEVSKTTSGTMGSRSAQFEFTLTLTGDNLGKHDVTMIKNDGEPISVEIESGTPYTFTLGHNDHAVFHGIAGGTQYQIAETLANTNGYITTIEGDTHGTLTEDVTVGFANEKNVVVPTRLRVMTPWIYGGLFAIVALLSSVGFFFWKRKKKIAKKKVDETA